MNLKYALLILRVIGIVLIIGGATLRLLNKPGANYILATGLALSVLSLAGLMWVLGKAVKN